MAEKNIEALSEPNKQYAKDFESYLQVLNRNSRTVWRRIYEVALASRAPEQRCKPSNKERH
jgi:hypothetical protein